MRANTVHSQAQAVTVVVSSRRLQSWARWEVVTAVVRAELGRPPTDRPPSAALDRPPSQTDMKNGTDVSDKKKHAHRHKNRNLHNVGIVG